MPTGCRDDDDDVDWEQAVRELGKRRRVPTGPEPAPVAPLCDAADTFAGDWAEVEALTQRQTKYKNMI